MPGAISIDLRGPWLAPLGPAVQTAHLAWQAGATVAAALNAVAAMANAGSSQLPAPALRFVPQADLPAGEAYEAFIHRSACVPTRENAHDFLNGLVWLAQPALKARLNALQAAEIARQGIGPQRGALRDALTLFDESGALLQAPLALWAALQRRDWQALFITQRALWRQATLTILGHALLEKLATAPRKALTAHVLLASDALVLDAAHWASKPFVPLPVLGVPGWWAGNADPAFYADSRVFRPARTPRSTDTARPCRS